MSNKTNNYTAKVEKIIAQAPSEVFRALSEGRLFLNCSADHESLKVDFRVGGKYEIEFANYKMKNWGTFLEIIPNRKIVFTWCQDYETNKTPDTTVTIELKEADNGTTAVSLIHTGFRDLQNKDAHQGGWTGGLDDLAQEITHGRLRLARKYAVSLERLFEICSDQPFGKLVESVPLKKMVFTHPQVTLLFDVEDDKSAAWLELIHEGLTSEKDQKTERAKWDALLKHLA